MENKKDEFGVPRTPKATKQQREKEEQVHAILDDMEREYGLKNLALFRAAADDEFRKFLTNIRGCPSFVLEFCQKKLAPDALTKHREGQRQKHKQAVEDAERCLESLRRKIVR